MKDTRTWEELSDEEKASYLAKQRKNFRRKLIGAGILLVVVVIGAVFVHFSFFDKNMNKGFFGIFDLTPDNDNEVGEVEEYISFARTELFLRRNEHFTDVRAEKYLKMYFNMPEDSRFPEDMPEVKRLSIQGYGFSKVNPVDANMILNSASGATHSVTEAYFSHELINGKETYLLFYTEFTDLPDWKVLPMTPEVKDELFQQGNE